MIIAALAAQASSAAFDRTDTYSASAAFAAYSARAAAAADAAARAAADAAVKAAAFAVDAVNAAAFEDASAFDTAFEDSAAFDRAFASDFYAALEADAAKAAAFDAATIFSQDIWYWEDWPEELDLAKLGPSLLDDPDFVFLRRWFFAMAEGKPLPIDLMTRIALEIEQGVWNSGDPKAVAAAIEAIEAHYNVTKALDALERDRKTVVQNRHGIGGNQPPEPVDDAHPLAGPVTVIWAAAEDIREETGKDVPDKSKVEAALAALKSGLNAILAWCGKKADLAIDTAIKWGVPAAGGGYVALNPDKVSALIKAVEAWLPHLP